MAREHRKKSHSRRDEDSDSSYSSSRSRSRSRDRRREHSRRRSHSSKYERRSRNRSRSVSSESDGSKGSGPSNNRKNDNDDYFPKATVSEVGGEISCSIEETNRIRAELGLPPLEIDNEEETKTEDGVVIVDMDKQRREEAIREKLERSKKERERLALQNLEGKSLGDLLTEETKELDVKQWLESSKEKQMMALEEMEEEEEKKEEEKERKLKESNVSLAGMKVAHDITEIGEGDTILTLRDAPLIDANGNVNDDEDVLESIDLVTKEKQKEINKLREKAKLPVYTGLDDQEFDSDYNEEDRFLPQYAEKKKKESFFTLTESGVSEADLEKSRMMAKERAKNTVVNPLKAAVGSIKTTTEKKSLTTLLSDINTEKKIASEYYTNEEMAQFKKKRKRVRKVRHIEREIEPLQLEEIKDEDMTSRKQIRELKKDEVDEEKKEREAGYMKAKAKEEVKNRGLRNKHADVPQEGVYDDPLLSDTLLRARKVVLGQRKQTIDEIAERIRKEREEEGVNEEEENANSGLEAVNEFTKRFKVLMNERKKEKEMAPVVEQTTKPEATPEPESKPEPESTPEVQTQTQTQTEEEPKKQEESEEDGFYDQPNISVGLGSVLAYLKSQNVHDTQEETYGRRTDNVIDTTNNKDGFVIEHRDKDGRLLTTKEAFRQLSYQFHGKTPGQKNKSRKNAKYSKGLANKGVY